MCLDCVVLMNDYQSVPGTITLSYVWIVFRGALSMALYLPGGALLSPVYSFPLNGIMAATSDHLLSGLGLYLYLFTESYTNEVLIIASIAFNVR